MSDMSCSQRLDLCFICFSLVVPGGWSFRWIVRTKLSHDCVEFMLNFSARASTSFLTAIMQCLAWRANETMKPCRRKSWDQTSWKNLFWSMNGCRKKMNILVPNWMNKSCISLTLPKTHIEKGAQWLQGIYAILLCGGFGASSKST